MKYKFAKKNKKNPLEKFEIFFKKAIKNKEMKNFR
jgi:hypothetical protein